MLSDALSSGDDPVSSGLWVERIALTGFRNYRALTVAAGPVPQVLVGANGTGKTNLLEAVSLLGPGQGLRRVPFADLARAGGDGSWAVAARVHTYMGPVEIGTGVNGAAVAGGRPGTGRIVRIDGAPQSGSGVLADLVDIIWLTPAMDGLFTGPAGDRRRFLDRLALGFDPGYRTRIGHFERAMASRNRLFADDVRETARFEGLERIMAETGVAVAAARAEVAAALGKVIDARRLHTPDDPFPWAGIALDGTLERALGSEPAIDVEDGYLRALRSGRERDRAAGRTLEGPHRSDLVVSHGPKAMPARVCSTGEQKALLVGLVLAHAELVRRRRGGTAPILLLDEIAAHLDATRRSSLFERIVALGSQAWLTGTDAEPFSALAGRSQVHLVAEGVLTPLVAGRAGAPEG